MSFFVSKSLEGKVDENCLVPNEDNSVLEKEFILKIKDCSCNILEIQIEKTERINSLPVYDTIFKIKAEMNVYALEKFLENNLAGVVKFKEKTIELEDICITKIFKKDIDNYITYMSGIVS